jgi:hypothetical protein
LIEGWVQACADFGTAPARVQRFTATGPELAMYRTDLKAFAASQHQECP